MGDDEITTPEKKVYTEDQVNDIIKAAQRRQLEADEMRTYGNMFFAEALDHISTLAKGDKVWKTVYEYGTLFRRQFETNTGQIREPAAPPAPAAKQREDNSADK